MPLDQPDGGNAVKQPGEIPRKELFHYAVGLAGQNLVYNMAGTNWFFHFCTNVLKLPAKTVGTMSGAITVYDACNDPIAGAIIDRHSFKNGKKLTPWLAYTSPFIAVLAFLLFINWGFQSQAAMIAYCVVIYLLWDSLYSFQDTALWGLTAMISPHSRQRARATQWADAGATAGSLLPGLLLGMLSGDGAFGMSQQQIYLLFAAVLCLGGGMLAGISAKVKERVPVVPQQESFFKSIGVLRHNHVMLLFLLSDIFLSLTPKIEDIYLYQQMEYTVFGKVMGAGALVLIIGAVTGVPGTLIKLVAVKVADRMGGMKRVMIIGRVADILVRVLTFFIGIDTFPKLVIVLTLQSVAYLPSSLFNIASRSMLADSVDYVEWKTNLRTEGITMSMRNFQSKFCSAIGRFMQGQTLHFLQYNSILVEKNLPQNMHFQKWVWPAHRLGPVFGSVLSLIPLLLLKFPDSLRAQVESDMAERRAMAGSAAEKIAEIEA